MELSTKAFLQGLAILIVGVTLWYSGVLYGHYAGQKQAYLQMYHEGCGSGE